MAKCLLTTKNNPHDPSKDFDSWYNYDQLFDQCCSLLDRVARTSDQLSEEENDREIERAIDDIIKYDLSNVYVKVVLKE